MLEGNTVRRGKGEATPPERQQFGGHLLYKRENVVHTSEAPEGTALLQNHSHMDNKSPTRKGGGETVNRLP